MSDIMRTVTIRWLFRMYLTMVVGSLVTIWVLVPRQYAWLIVFVTFFILRYARFFGHVVGYLLYRPSPLTDSPVYTNRSVTVILPTVDPTGPDFDECVRSILANEPASLIIVTVGADLKQECSRIIGGIPHEARANTEVAVTAIARPSKRRQISHALSSVTTEITVCVDDHVFWRPTFLQSALHPFDNEKVGVVGTRKTVRRTTPGKFSCLSIINFIACNYLQRHNWELRASDAIDGGVFVVSGRTALYRTQFLANPAVQAKYCNERFFFGLLGGIFLGPDDDNALTRMCIQAGWLIRFQDTEEATIETTLGGGFVKFDGQLKRWARTTFRSNPVMLRDPKFLCHYSWSAPMVYLAGITNFAMLWDGLLIVSLVFTLQGSPQAQLPLASAGWLVLLIVWILTTKIVKILPCLFRNPWDWLLVPFQIMFAYIHSFYKLWALLTFWDCDWSGRKLDEVAPMGNAEAAPAENPESAPVENGEATPADALGEFEIIA